MPKILNRMTILALMLGAGSSFAADRLSVTIVDPNDNKPVANQELHVSPNGAKSRLLRTDENGQLTLPSSFAGKETAIRCSKVPLIYNTHQRLESGMTIVLKHTCGGTTSYK